MSIVNLINREDSPSSEKKAITKHHVYELIQWEIQS